MSFLWQDRPTVWGASVYPRRAASTRLRLDLLLEPLRRKGVDLFGWSYLCDGELDGWIQGGYRRLAPALHGVPRTKQFLHDSRSASAIIVQREILPWNTLVTETACARRGPLIWDIDDAMWLSSAGIRGQVRGTPEKYARLARVADEVWAGSETVADWCISKGARSVRLVPTVTPIPVESAVSSFPRRLAWVGTPATARYLEQVLIRHHDAFAGWVIEVVGADLPAISGLSIEAYKWSPESEHRALSRAWAGIYPIDIDHEFAAGKSALKAILMAAYGLPVIATYTRSNAAVVEHGVTGLLVNGELSWREALRQVSDPNLHGKLGSAARIKAQRDYDPDFWGEYLADVVLALMGSS